MKADGQTEAAMVGMLDRFCSAFEARDVEAVMQLFAPDPDVVVVTSEESLLRGPDELQDFLRAYVQGPTAYSWTWDHVKVSNADNVAWLIAEGTETAATQAGEQKHPYRMTMVCQKRDEHWLLLQVHGSSPHDG
jgi:uncharacterized protein (TIGR02246 family)